MMNTCNERWRDNEGKLVKGFYIDTYSCITHICIQNTRMSFNVFATKKQAISALAMARISQIMANDERFGGVVTDEEWCDCALLKYIITRDHNYIDTSRYFNCYYFLAFHTAEQRDLFIKENEDLIKDYLMID